MTGCDVSVVTSGEVLDGTRDHVRDYDFPLFVDAGTGQGGAVCRAGPTGYRLARLPGLAPVAMPWTINVGVVPRLTPGQAAGRLDTTEMPYRFFRDATTGRGSLLYQRYDGQYGLLAGAATEDGP